MASRAGMVVVMPCSFSGFVSLGGQSGLSAGGPARPSGAADHDVAVAGAGADFDHGIGGLGAVGGVHVVAHVAEAGEQVEAGGGAGPHADLDLAVARLDLDRAAADLAEPDLAV